MRLKPSHITAAILSLIFIACHSGSQPAVAAAPRTNKQPQGKFAEVPVKAAITLLSYDTTSPQGKELISRLDAYYITQVRAGFNGSVLVGYQGRVIYERYFGVSNREKKIPLGPNSSSQLASVSKTFTGSAVLYLYERKYIDLDAPVQRYLPQFPYQAVTIRMLLNHRSGVPDYTKWVPNYDKDSRTPITNDLMMSMMAKYKPSLEFTPGRRFKYCNTNFAVLAKVIETVTGMPYSDFMTKYVFQPLGMDHTFVYDPAKGLPPEATISYKYNWIREPDMFADGVHGDKGIYSTTEDMYRWDQSFYHNTLLSNETVELAYGPCSFEKKGIKNYGLGWRMLCFPNGNKIIYHNGWWHGNNTSFYRLIKDNLTIIVLGNRFTNSIYHQAPAIYGILKGAATSKNFDTED